MHSGLPMTRTSNRLPSHSGAVRTAALAIALVVAAASGAFAAVAMRPDASNDSASAAPLATDASLRVK